MLARLAWRGVQTTTLASAITTLCSIAQVAILARLLNKEDFGLFATVSVVMGLSAFFAEAGTSSAVIHRQDATRSQLATAYLISLGSGVLVWAALFALAGPIAAFYEDARLVTPIRVAACAMLIQPLGMQYAALLQRDLLFGALARLDILAALAGLVAAVTLAWSGFGLYSLILAQLLAVGLRTAALLALGIPRFGFSLRGSMEETRYFLRFGGFQIGDNVINYLNVNIDVILVGRLLGQESLGLYYAAKQLVFRPIGVINPIISKVALPVFARVQNDLPQLKSAYLGIVHALAIVHVAIFALLAAFAGEVVLLLLGAAWLDAAVLVAVLCLYVLPRALGNPVGSLILARGRVEVGFYWNLAIVFYIPPFMAVGAHWGVTGLVWSLVVATLCLQIPAWYFLVYRLCGARLGEYFRNILASLAAGCLCFGPLFLIDSPVARIAAVVPCLAAYALLHRQRIATLRRALS